ncbi:MipA/OmpV family protein [Desulfonema ishimotonii]|uniref:MipA/OmpV family protein n=1 Tax=Desulfonema ishimotonii TaxID=45657 RepID=A0A401G316_9BACT|nr:MipA/OmpV family protein [Desulfonema ishimotonii]GBC63639.1 MipA/OmpV family protein [Desulfonema ishimotonii]
MKGSFRVMTLGAGLCLLFLMTGGPAAAQGIKKASVGVGVAAIPDYEGSEDYEAIPVPILGIEWHSGRFVRLAGPGLRWNVLASNIWRFGPSLGYTWERDDVDNKKVDRMRKVDSAVEGGAFIGYENEDFYITFDFLRDISDEHDGYTMTLNGEWKLPVNDQLRFFLGASAIYADDSYMETYFGVDADNASRSGLKEYDAEAGVKNVGIHLSAMYTPWENWGLNFGVGYKRLLGDAKDSPLVDDEGSANQFFGMFGVAYSF